MAADFVHLHLHTHYSMLDGACTAKGIVKLAKSMDMIGAAITDHGYVGGAEEYHRLLTEAGLRPVIGCEAYMAPGSRHDKDPRTPHCKGFHLVLLCENDTGYHNLCKLISEAYRTGLYYKPRIDRELLTQYHEGLIALSACVQGQVPRRYLDSDPRASEEALKFYRDLFGRDHFFLEVMDHGIPEERAANRHLVELAEQYDLEMVATNDVHYMKKEDAAAHEVMLCIQTGTKLAEEHMKFSGPEYYFKSEAEMKQIFSELPRAITNTRAIAERCEIHFDYKTNHYPVFYLPDKSVPTKETLRQICYDNMVYRFDFDPRKDDCSTPERKAILDRMEYELGIIEKTGFCSYFMVVSDFIRYGKDHGVPVGPGRGSGAGSLVAYLMRITDIDPLRYNLLFERFLNPERVSPPDFDIDFCEKRRGEVIEYVRQKYGFDSVAQICTYGQLKPKAVVKDVARVLGFSFDEGNRLTKLIPDDLKITIDAAIEQSAELKKLIDTDDRVRELFKYARVLEGLNRQAGIHAAGVIIGDQQLDNLVPLSRSAQGDMVVQYTKEPCEHLGLLKMDFLGLRTLTIIRNALDMIKADHGVDIDPIKIPLDDPKTFDMLRRGDTVAVFQLESGGMQNLCRNLGVETIEHIIALVALYRPGPMKFIPQYIACKKGLEKTVYDHPKMEPILKETYGIMVYQEQIMQVVQALAGFTLGGADILRRAIGKKKEEVMAQQREIFIKGCAEHSDIPEKLASEIWEKIKIFAGYGFNKSHSAAYGIVSYQTAYLKANYPVEFMAAVLTGEIENADKLAFLIRACRDMGIKILPPDVNSSGISFSCDGDAIRFGLGAIKGVGEAAAGAILNSRKADGKFSSFLDFCERCGTEVNSRMLECLTRAGAFDSLQLRRSQILAIAEPMIALAANQAKDRAAGQGSLFDMLSGEESHEAVSVPIPDLPEFSWDEILKNEKQLLGFYISGHPLDPLRELVGAFGEPVRGLAEKPDGEALRITGMVSDITYKFSKTSKRQFGVMHIEDLDANCECMIYERTIGKLRDAGVLLEPGNAYVFEVTISRRDESEPARVILEQATPLSEAPEKLGEELYLHVYRDRHCSEIRKRLAGALRRHPGNAVVKICFVGNDDSVVFLESRSITVAPSMELLSEIDAILGTGCYRIKAKEFVAPPRRVWQPRESTLPAP
ncbi:MAG: DNA polymerase III subunit alpha [Victivallaceae bacterium]|nr:DNA polymerase III subunit alpha [Victivallaceae bacterium]